MLFFSFFRHLHSAPLPTRAALVHTCMHIVHLVNLSAVTSSQHICTLPHPAFTYTLLLLPPLFSLLSPQLTSLPLSPTHFSPPPHAHRWMRCSPTLTKSISWFALLRRASTNSLHSKRSSTRSRSSLMTSIFDPTPTCPPGSLDWIRRFVSSLTHIHVYTYMYKGLALTGVGPIHELHVPGKGSVRINRIH